MKITPNKIPAHNATVVNQLEDAGAIILGMTKSTGLAYLGSTETRNPHNINHTPGGSSCGSAAVAATGTATFTIGEQTNGSVIRPASFCGVYGYKPSFGIISLAGFSPLTIGMDHPGLLTEKPEYLLRILDVLAQYDGSDINNRYLPSGDELPQKLNIGILPLEENLDISKDMMDRLNDYKQALVNEGHRVETALIPEGFWEYGEIWKDIYLPEFYHYYKYIFENDEINKLSVLLQELLNTAKNSKSMDIYFEAYDKRKNLFYKIDRLFNDYDILVLPAALGAATPGLESTGSPAATTFTSVTGIPAVTIPFGVDKMGLPLGIQVLARKYRDRFLLKTIEKLPANPVKPALHIDNC